MLYVIIPLVDLPTFHIGSIAVFGELILAPMDGITSHPFRLLTRRYGSSVSYSEFVGAIDIIYGRPHLEDHLFFHEDERPFGYQIIDNDPQRILQAALILQKRQPDFIDVNMGCSARDVSSRGAGAGLLRDLDKVKTIFTLLVKNLPVPITAKIRIGWDDEHLNYLQTARLLEDCGVAAIAVHGRTRQQAYDGFANWDAIAEVKARSAVPVIANGDVRTVADIARIQAHTACDAVMIGRAAVSNPWIFAKRDRDQIAQSELFATIEENLSLMINFYGMPAGLVFFRKHLVHYLRPYTLPTELRQSLLTCDDLSVFRGLLTVLRDNLSQILA